MVEVACVLGHDSGDFRVPVAQQRTHLARGEVQDRAAIRVIHEAALRPLDDHRFKGAAVADQVPTRGLSEIGVVVAGHRVLQMNW